MTGLNSKIEILIYPGWGFGTEAWTDWQACLGDSFQINVWNPGYFGAGQEVHFTGLHNRLNVIFTHSFGLHQCPLKHLKAADMLIVFGGFIQFHPVAAQYRRRSRLMVRKMISRMNEAPDEVVMDFWKNCYYPDLNRSINKPKNVNKQRLTEDLKRLNNEKLDIDILTYLSSVCILHGGKDAIVPKAKGRELYDKLPTNGYYYEIREAGHALPFTHTSLCWSFMRPIINEYA